jgi:hypothetical protein
MASRTSDRISGALGTIAWTWATIASVILSIQAHLVLVALLEAIVGGLGTYSFILQFLGKDNLMKRVNNRGRQKPSNDIDQGPNGR